MPSWTDKQLLALDKKYAEEGVAMHARPFHAARDILGTAFVLGGGSNVVKQVMDDYARLIPEVQTSWPGMGIGLAISVDRVRKFVTPVVMGNQFLHVWQSLEFKSDQEWWTWCREDHMIASESAYAVADMHDLAYGLSDGISDAEGNKLWRMATSNLEDVANNLPNAFSVDSVLQPICMVVELSLKALLVSIGAKTAKDFKGPAGHNLVALAQLVETTKPHVDDPLVRNLIDNLPPYVESRYSPAGLTRLRVVRLALGAQFVAASMMRRIATRDMAAEFAIGPFPGPRQPYFGITK